MTPTSKSPSRSTCFAGPRNHGDSSSEIVFADSSTFHNRDPAAISYRVADCSFRTSPGARTRICDSVPSFVNCNSSVDAPRSSSNTFENGTVAALAVPRLLEKNHVTRTSTDIAAATAPRMARENMGTLRVGTGTTGMGWTVIGDKGLECWTAWVFVSPAPSRPAFSVALSTNTSDNC